MIKSKMILALLLGIVAIGISPVLAQVLPAYFDINNAEVSTKSKLKVELYTVADVPVAGEDLLGYGVLTSGGDSLVVTTSHGGALDSIVQTSAADPVWHNHYVKLQLDGQCPPGLAGTLSVADLSWTSPGKLKVDETEVKMTSITTGALTNIPSGVTLGATNSNFNTGTPTDQVVSFQLSIGPSGQVCVDVKDIITASD